jgi:hypothetical protein
MVEENTGGETRSNFSLTEGISEIIFDSDIHVYVITFITFTYSSQEQHREITTVFTDNRDRTRFRHPHSSSE